MEILKIAILILLTVILSNGISFISKEFTVLITLLCCIVVLLEYACDKFILKVINNA